MSSTLDLDDEVVMFIANRINGGKLGDQPAGFLRVFDRGPGDLAVVIWNDFGRSFGWEPVGTPRSLVRQLGATAQRFFGTGTAYRHTTDPVGLVNALAACLRAHCRDIRRNGQR